MKNTMKWKSPINLKPLEIKGQNLWMAMAFAVPILCLLLAVGLNEWRLRTGQTVVLPVEGYDPRDLLSGRYLRYKILYKAPCPPSEKQSAPKGTTKIPSKLAFLKTKQRAYLCLQGEKQNSVSRSAPQNCPLFIKGLCLGKEGFYAGGDRLYLPDSKARDLEKLFHGAGKKEVVLSITKGGRVLAKDILIDGRSLKKISRGSRR